MTIAEIAAQREYNYGRMTIGECIAVADRGEGIGRRGDHNGGVRRYPGGAERRLRRAWTRLLPIICVPQK